MIKDQASVLGMHIVDGHGLDDGEGVAEEDEGFCDVSGNGKSSGIQGSRSENERMRTFTVS